MASFTVRAFAVASCLCLLAVAWPAPARSSLITRNLLINGGAELGPAATTPTQIVRPRSWKTIGSLTAVRYGVSGLPGNVTSQNIGGGRQFFAGGPNTAPASATQVVRIPVAWRKLVASGLAFAQLSADLGGSQTQPDAAVVAVQYLSSTGKVLGGFKVGPVGPAQRQNLTGMLPVQAVRGIARKTAAIRVTIASAGGTGAYNDAYADNVALRLLQ
ncbi:MAG: hypothetical protein ACYDCH_03585 [Gaiellaceae bacterium]